MLPTDAAAQLEELQIVDVRQPYEFEAGHLAGSILIPLRELPARVDELDRDERTLVVCQIGQRSDMAARYLRSLGIDAHNLDGGLERWLGSGLPLVADGRDGTIVDGYGTILED